MKKPSIGRIVWYQCKYGNEESCLPAIITKVHSTNTYINEMTEPIQDGSGNVDLVVFSATHAGNNGGSFCILSVKFSPEPKSSHWSWPEEE